MFSFVMSVRNRCLTPRLESCINQPKYCSLETNTDGELESWQKSDVSLALDKTSHDIFAIFSAPCHISSVSTPPSHKTGSFLFSGTAGLVRNQIRPRSRYFFWLVHKRLYEIILCKSPS